ncbi:MAG: hypothetical protein GY750_19625 [Lentisphaerae bacterium]|nr:hypothetical protein [Lentisphaerota bacterium]MCP4103608.1 hypothetical protein [Lentisphaerota bacterium]
MVRIISALLALGICFSMSAFGKSSLIAWYKLDGNLKDSSGNNHNLTPFSGSMTFIDSPETGGKCLVPGVNKGASGPVLPLNRNTGFCISGFMALPEDNSYQGNIFGCGNSDYDKPGAIISTPWGVINTKVGNGRLKPFKRFNDSEWHHYTLVIPPASKSRKYILYYRREKSA